MTKVSVIIPVYNVEKYLKKCLDSIINQTLKDIEIICINDGSTDSSLDILNDYAKKDKRFKIFSQKNQGLGAARNAGLLLAKGDYIYFIDSDDYISTYCLEKLYNNALSNDSDLVINKIGRFTNEGEINYSHPGFDLNQIFDNVDFNKFIFNYKDIKPYVLNKSFSAWSKLYKKSFLDEYSDFTFPVSIAYEDVLFHVKSLIRSSKISFLPEFVYYYRLSNKNSITHIESNALDIFEVINSVEEFLSNNKIIDEFKNEFITFKITQITQYIIFSNSEEFFKLAKEELNKTFLNKEIIINSISIQKHKLIIESESLKEFNEKYQLQNEINKLKNDNKELNEKNKKLNEKNKKLNEKNKKLKRKQDEILNSNSWKITKPLRKIRNL